jgi:aspartate aminotransferase-like enzyme
MDFESLLRQALQPIEPPGDLEERLEERFRVAAVAAAEELEGWELSTMRDPRNWIPTVTAAGVGVSAAVGLVLVRTQRRRHKRRAASDNVLQLAEHTVRDLAREAGKVIDEGRRRL